MPTRKKADLNLPEHEGPFKSAWHAIGDPDADAMVAKSTLVAAIADGIKAKGLTQTAAAEAMGIAQPHLSRILSGRFRSVTFDQLFKLLNALGVGVHVTFGPQEEGVSVTAS